MKLSNERSRAVCMRRFILKAAILVTSLSLAACGDPDSELPSDLESRPRVLRDASPPPQIDHHEPPLLDSEVQLIDRSDIPESTAMPEDQQDNQPSMDAQSPEDPPYDPVTVVAHTRPDPIRDPSLPTGLANLSWLDATFVSNGVYISNELLIMTRTQGEIIPMLERHRLEIIDSVNLMDEYWLHRVRVPVISTTLEHKVRRLLDSHRFPDDGPIRVSDEEILTSYAIALEERELGNTVSLNPLIQPQGDINEGEEAGIGPPGYDANPSTWGYLGDDLSGFNILRAWALFHHALEDSMMTEVAVIDTGFTTHSDLSDEHHIISWLGDEIESVHAGHGTNVAATIAGRKGNGLGTVGIGYPSARLMMIDYDTPTLFHGLSSLGPALTSEAAIINISWITSPPLPGTMNAHGGLFDVFFADLNRSTLVIAAAGNQSRDLDSRFPNAFPCSASAVLCVGGVDPQKRLHIDSNYGTQEHGSTVDLYAPYTTYAYRNPDMPGHGVNNISGTSMSAAVIAGAASLLSAADPELTPAEIKDALLRSADQFDGYPTLNGFEALRLVIGNTSPSVHIIEPSSSSSPRVAIHQHLTLRASSYDIEDDSSAVIRWESSLQGELGAGDEIRVSLNVIGQHEITAIATDSEGSVSQVSQLITVESQPPNLTIESLGAGFLDNITDAGTAVLLSAHATDPNMNHRPIPCDRIRWIDITDEEDILLGLGCELTVPGLRPGQRAIQCSVSNHMGQETTESRIIHALSGDFLAAPLTNMIAPREARDGTAPSIDWEDSQELRAMAIAPNDPHAQQILRYRWTYSPMIRGLFRGEREIVDGPIGEFSPSHYLAGPCREQLVRMNLEVSNVVDETTRVSRLVRVLCR